MSSVLQPYDHTLAAEWDAFIQQASTGTFLHSRRFLSYHGDRFRDMSLLVRDESGRLIALFPAALSPSDQRVVVSHPGATYGGLLAGPSCRGESILRILQAICHHYKNNGLRQLQYKVVPFFYHRGPMQDDLYALFRLGAYRYRCDISATIDLAHRGRVSSRRRRGRGKAAKAGVRIATGVDLAPSIWAVLRNNLRRKHNTSPTHSLPEILLLHDRFPAHIQFVAATLGEEVIAGVVLFHSAMVSHAQYIASTDAGNAVNALDKLFEHCIAESVAQGKRYFDFGISNEEDGQVLNRGLYAFKSEFGAGGTVHEFYRIDLEDMHVA